VASVATAERRPKAEPSAIAPPIRPPIAAAAPAPVPKSDAIEVTARDTRRSWLIGALALLLLGAIGFLWISTGQRTSEQASGAAPAQVAPKPTARNLTIEKPARVSTPTAPTRPPN
jgi:hypothetical protein